MQSFVKFCQNELHHYTILQVAVLGLAAGEMAGESTTAFAKELDVALPNVTRAVQTLERDGLAENAINPEDMRCRSITVTQAGMDMLKRFEFCLP